MSTFEELMFDAEWGRATDDLQASMVHAHTEPECVFCATRTGQDAKVHATQVVTRDLHWWHETGQWLDRQLPGFVFTADDLVAAVGKPSGSANQIGARLRSWAMAHLINPIGITDAVRPESHGRLLRTWQVPE